MSNLFRKHYQVEFRFLDEVDSESQGCSQGSSFSQSSLFDEEGNEIMNEVTDDCSLERKQEILKFISFHPTWSVKTIQGRGFKEYKHAYYKKRWEEYVAKGGNKYEKYAFIEKFTHEKFLEARNEYKCIRDVNLHQWALQAAQTFKDSSFVFKASHTWVDNFKKRHGISSRKVTQLVNKRQIKNVSGIMKAAKEFQANIKNEAQKYNPELVFNTDQAQFFYEIAGTRTLSHKGEKLTLAFARSPTNAVTHSYTVQYIINLAGNIVGDVFLCLQEKSGRFGPQVEANIFHAPNVTLSCSVSGKLTSSIFSYFVEKVLKPSVNGDFIFIIDSWSGQTNRNIYDEHFGSEGQHNCNLKIIPEKTTSICQPLDTTFHRQLKYFARKIYATSTLEYSDENRADEITTRNNIIKLQSLLHNQLSAPIFKPMIRYCWFSSGLSDEKPLFLSVKEACFLFEQNESATCFTGNCDQLRFVKCAHCRVILCFSCFFHQYHMHF